jgi:coproporphyrinogen III oxidase-like Fe-S oxidoreductase
VDWEKLRSGAGGALAAKYEASLDDLTFRGLVERKGSMLRLTESGMLLSNEVFQVFV